ncbi:hypothetical protein CFIMG_006603RA [Ceratocystis fimbriata CBS 114723]|uniref:Uncharacterized protein n=1 Tax=Ceratocystis fimbriata CBS 114723 TaxID=1035309 RepID=A0A2C5WG10_9PEZI|nr:hypothetical protein CFIMG_006603RA [Ceratocystis fimbriata CBS 114723]
MFQEKTARLRSTRLGASFAAEAFDAAVFFVAVPEAALPREVVDDLDIAVPGLLEVFLTTVEELLLLSPLVLRVTRVAVAGATACFEAAVRLVRDDAVVDAVELAVLVTEAVVALRVMAARVVFAFSTMLERRLARDVLTGDAARETGTLIGEALVGDCCQDRGTRREFDEVGERTGPFSEALAGTARARFLGYSMGSLLPLSFSLSPPSMALLVRLKRRVVCVGAANEGTAFIPGRAMGATVDLVMPAAIFAAIWAERSCCWTCL